MGSLAADLCALAGMLALLAFLLLSTLKINRNRKVRTQTRRLAARLMYWK